MNIKKDDLPLVVKLEVPVEISPSETKTEVTIRRRPRAGDLFDIDPQKIRLGDMFGLVSKVTGETKDTIAKLDIADAMGLIEVVQGFLPNSLQDGGNL